MGKRVLIADDSDNTRGILRFMLQNQGYEFVEAADGEAALEKARASAPDLVILDGMMPKLSGFDVCRELKQDPRTSSIPVILLTAAAQADPGRDWARETPADRFLAKPFQMRELMALVEAFTGPVHASESAVRRLSELDERPQGTVLRNKDPLREA